jgi:hypothetical protein
MTMTALDRTLVAGDAGRATGERQERSAFIDEAGTETFKAVAVIADEALSGG